MTLWRPSLARPGVEVTHGLQPWPSASGKHGCSLGLLPGSEVGRWMVRPRGLKVQGHPGQLATLGVAPLALPTASSRAGREPYLAFGDPEAHVGLHAGGSATAPWELRGSRVSSSSCSSSWDLRDGWGGGCRQARRGGGAGRRAPPPARARPLCRVPKPARSLLCVTTRQQPGTPLSWVPACYHLPAPGFPRTCCSVSPPSKPPDPTPLPPLVL